MSASVMRLAVQLRAPLLSRHDNADGEEAAQ